jgi:hypothetical protein
LLSLENPSHQPVHSSTKKGYVNLLLHR